MTKRNLAIVLACCACALTFGLAGCTGSSTSSSAASSGGSSSASASSSSSSAESSSSSASSSSAAVSSDASPSASAASYNKATIPDTALGQGISCWYGVNGMKYDMAKAREIFLKAANEGDSDGWYYLGLLRAMDSDPERWPQVQSYFDKAVQEGSSLGLVGQAYLYNSGLGVAKDQAKAVELYQQAADAGNALASVQLANAYAKGEGVESDSAKAMEMLEAAANSGDYVASNDALKLIGDLYLDGIGVQADVEKAIEYYQMASENGNALASQSLGKLYQLGEKVEADAAKAKQYFEKATEGGRYYDLALSLAYSDQPDYERAIELCMKDVNGGKDRAMAMCLLSYLYSEGLGVEKDDTAAANWAYQAIDAANCFDVLNEDMKANPAKYGQYILQELGVK